MLEKDSGHCSNRMSDDSTLPSFKPDGHSDASSPSDTPEEMEIDEGMRLISADVSCDNCAHQQICTLQSGLAPMLEGWKAGDQGPPIDINDLAVICDVYLPEDEVNGQ